MSHFFCLLGCRNGAYSAMYQLISMDTRYRRNQHKRGVEPRAKESLYVHLCT